MKVIQVNCLNCGKMVSRKPKKYCNNNCQAAFAHKTYIARWLAGKEQGWSCTIPVLSDHIRNYLITTRGEMCELCGWAKRNPYTGKIPIQIHHLDGNAKHCKAENLQLLCPSCHSLTSNFGRRGGDGRQMRYR